MMNRSNTKKSFISGPTFLSTESCIKHGEKLEVKARICFKWFLSKIPTLDHPLKRLQTSEFNWCRETILAKRPTGAKFAMQPSSRIKPAWGWQYSHDTHSSLRLPEHIVTGHCCKKTGTNELHSHKSFTNPPSRIRAKICGKQLAP